jgi:hypothetical protein
MNISSSKVVEVKPSLSNSIEKLLDNDYIYRNLVAVVGWVLIKKIRSVET